MARLHAIVRLGITALLATAAGCAAEGAQAEGELESDELVDTATYALRGPSASALPAHALVAWAALDQSARWPGPTSGQFITPANGVVPPFEHAQPIPGWSGLLPDQLGRYIAMPDNGFGAKGNSADYVLGFYTVEPHFKFWRDGTATPGTVKNRQFTAFNDRRGLLKNGAGVELTITADRANYFSGNGSGTDSGIAVDASIRSERKLTGYDFDIESIARATDGTFWVGEEFGPYLLHFGQDGALLEEPVAHPFLKSPNHPDVLAGSAQATLGGSRGFESLAFDHRDRLLYAVPEAAPSVDALRPLPGDERVLEIFEFDPRARAYTGRAFKYRKDGAATNNNIVIGDMTNLAPDVFVLIERDSLFGPSAVVKRLYLIDLNVKDDAGVLVKRLLVDLLDVSDPLDIGGPLANVADEHKFSMPFDSIESVAQLDPYTLAVAIDTNFPGEDGRTKGVPDSTEIIKLRFARRVASYAPQR